MYNVQEMATAVQQKINAVVIVFNDSAFGNVLRDQRDRFQGRVYGSELHNPGLHDAGQGVWHARRPGRHRGGTRSATPRGAGRGGTNANRGALRADAVSVLRSFVLAMSLQHLAEPRPDEYTIN